MAFHLRSLSIPKPPSGHHERLASIHAPNGDEFKVVVRWELVGGRPEPTLVSVFTEPPRPVSASAIRKLAIGGLLTDMRADLATESVIFQSGNPTSPSGRVRRAAVNRGPQRGRSLTREVLTEVAEVYRRAWISGLPVTSAVADHFHISPSTAGKRIMAAKAAGLLEGVKE